MGKARDWIERYKDFDGDECLPWPYCVDKYGYGSGLFFERKVQKSHRVMCEITHGPPPTEKHQAAHSCHNRICCNPRHLSWMTNSENQLGRRENGTAVTAPFGQGGRVLTPEQIAEIKVLDGNITRHELARRFGCSRRTIERAVAA